MGEIVSKMNLTLGDHELLSLHAMLPELMSLFDQKTINAKYYSTLLTEKVKPASRSKRTKPQNSVCFLQDNVRPYTGTLTMETLRKLKWDVLPHPPYSPDLVPSDFNLFVLLKEFLGGKRFRDNDEVIAAV